MKRIANSWLVLTTLLCASAAWADAAPALRVRITPEGKASLGGVVQLHLEVDAPEGVEVSVPEQSLSPFELSERRAGESVDPSGKRTLAFDLDLVALEPGELKVPSLTVRLVDAKGEISELHTEATTISVASPIANEPNAAPKPLAEPVSVMRDDYTLLWVLGGLAAVALIAALTLLISRYLKRRPKPLPPPVPEVPPWVSALQKLERLARDKDALLRADQGELFIDGVSAVVREYLGKRYGFDGLERTSDELMRILEAIRPHKLTLSSVSILLEQCDLVKFARVKPDLATCDELWSGAVSMVRATTDAPTPVAAAPITPERAAP